MRRSRMKTQRGFTLIELMVAIFIMALLALMSWRGIDGMARSQEQNRVRGDAVLTLQTTFSQWSADLDAMTPLAGTRPLDWDGRLLRLTRRGTDDLKPAVYVVAWTLRNEADGMHWSRWQSTPLTRRDEWQQAWAGAAAWAQGDGDSSIAGRRRGHPDAGRQLAALLLPQQQLEPGGGRRFALGALTTRYPTACGWC